MPSRRAWVGLGTLTTWPLKLASASTAGTTTVCGKPRANLSIAVFSNANNAGALRDQINTKFGNPVLIDCN